MKQLRLALAVCLAASLLALPAAAKDLNGRFAIGGGYTLLGNSGLQAKYYAGHLGIGMMVSYLNQSESQSVTTNDASGNPVTQTADVDQNEADVSLRLTYNIARAKDTNFIGGVGLTYGNFSTKDVYGKDTSWSEEGVEIIVCLEHFFGNHFSLTFETGLPWRFPGDKNGGAIGRLTGATVLGKGKMLRFGSVTPTLASSFNFYF